MSERRTSVTRRRAGGVRARGFASVVAMGLAVIVSLALLATTRRLVEEGRAAQQDRAEAQLRQLLQAGASWAGPIVLTHTSAPEAALREREWEPPVELPLELRESGAGLTIRSVPHATRLRHDVEVVARLGDRRRSQTLRYVRAGDRWGMVEATLE